MESQWTTSSTSLTAAASASRGLNHEKPTLSVVGLLLKSVRHLCLSTSKLWTFLLLNIRKLLFLFIRIWACLYVSIRMSKKKYKKGKKYTDFTEFFKCAVSENFLPKKILVLDLDETLIHSHHDGLSRVVTVKPTGLPDFIIRVEIERHPVRFFVYKRPHVDYFLEIVSKWYELVVFTASMEIYGAAVADKLDNNKNILNRRYYRQHCTLEFGAYSKDLAAINDDLSRIFILDNSPIAYRSYPSNAIPIKSWFFDPTDTCLLSLLPFLDALRFCRDVRSVLVVLYIVWTIYKYLFRATWVNPSGKYVLISGCDSGFGFGSAVELDRQGYSIFAGVYTNEGKKLLSEKLSSKATVFKLDITNQQDIENCLELVKRKTINLHALINNAGIGKGGLIDWTSMSTYREVMDVNFFSHVAMTKTFLPLLCQQADSRVINLCSMCGYFSAPGLSAYSACADSNITLPLYYINLYFTLNKSYR
ncbi:unnamed protein product [Didymodactylos carnosus]|uniref:protein-serine/threonine phosphatase n=1 Tax=Didymodactylos carnosus TaxID=1234261 RepID=A0A813U5C2_9BILA|nr:unnamed protein product [Didymodactylos carnosus]CAF3609489.1 unnamed protein product [Didymodactylos carnosus]